MRNVRRTRDVTAHRRIDRLEPFLLILISSLKIKKSSLRDGSLSFFMVQSQKVVLGVSR